MCIRDRIWCGGAQRHAQLQAVKDRHTYMDPEAAQYVLEQGLNLTMCPVDVGKRCFMTVSYTHLDVYKRQTQDLTNRSDSHLHPPLPRLSPTEWSHIVPAGVSQIRKYQNRSFKSAVVSGFKTSV